MIAHNDGSDWTSCFCDMCEGLRKEMLRLTSIRVSNFYLNGEPMKLDEIYAGGSDSIKAEDLKGKDVTLTIAGMEVREFDEEGKYGAYKAKKIVLSFAETDKTFVLNKTNGYSIAELIGIDDPSLWKGAKITIFQTRTNFGNKMVDCIRIRSAKPPIGVATPADMEGDDVPF